MMGKSMLLILLLINITTRGASDAHVTSCEACHSEATCLMMEETGDTLSSATSFSCFCKEGFVGDGNSCYEVKKCGSGFNCCNLGYKWSPKKGCVDIDECSLEPSPCGKSQICKNTEGSYECITNPLRTPASDVKAVQFSCGNNVCPQGMDCITVSGTSRCADPCTHYTELNDQWRATDYHQQGNPKCDRYVEWQGWYRLFLNGKNAQIPERCIREYMCGTNAPMYITTPHPKQFNNIETRDVCPSYSSCCFANTPSIHVKRCYGPYYVYKLVKPVRCPLAYCAENQPETEVEVKELICGQDNIQVTLSKVIVSALGLDPMSGHLVNRSCTRTRVQNNTVWYEVEPQGGACGTIRRTNDTHVSYSNSLFLYPLNNNSFNVPTSLLFTCVYPLEADASLNAALVPLLPAGGIVGSGHARSASMLLYRDQNFNSTYPSGSVSLPVGQPLYVGVSVQDNDLNVVTVLDNCYATYSSDPHDPMKHPFIQNKCPTDPQQVLVLESGASLRARFSALFFVPEGQIRKVYLHCHLSLCSPGPCVPVCSGRRRRSVSETAAVKPVTVGPITWRH